jgi:hypothetical protein
MARQYLYCCGQNIWYIISEIMDIGVEYDMFDVEHGKVCGFEWCICNA